MSQMEPHYWPSFEVEMDSEAQVLADAYGLSMATAVKICNQYRAAADRERIERAAPIVADILAWLIKPCRNLPAKVLGLACSFNIIDLISGSSVNGISGMADEARARGLSRAAISHWKRVADRQFGRYGAVFGKSPEACENNRKARMRVLANGKKHITAKLPERPAPKTLEERAVSDIEYVGNDQLGRPVVCGWVDGSDEDIYE